MSADKNRRAPELAVALQYDGERAPRVTAKGSGELAEQIIALAREHEVPLQENAPMVELLSKLELGEEIPPALYLAVAEIIAFAYYISGRTPTDACSAPGSAQGGDAE
ncbi:EscU/YscU/HrcU family type III secretion system export apparatus switch protein [Thiohalobacter thiocyanaticus]|uniref:Flagellar biosynthetic protein FlhB n=1 Tax=Thiohalobacter thiocyanaticus TaxID=585455 RepID=A0A426QGL3_9GAMM|nr:EscU/YscU/HrcU family type III secretion system export apparatus switch protein [Thiohalobacter thiocyanaticus]RRQ20884.1 flagellar biosynthesis protein FlhB [Thiohalobacter thiocyanaticus]